MKRSSAGRKGQVSGFSQLVGRIMHTIPAPEKPLTHLHDETGAALVEASFSFILFLSIFFLSYDLLRLGYHTSLVQFIATRAVQEGSILTGTAEERCDQIIDNAIQLVHDFGLDGRINPNEDMRLIRTNGQTRASQCGAAALPPGTIPPLPGGDPFGGLSDAQKSAGLPEELLGFVIRYNVQFFFGYNYSVRGVAFARNEPEDVG